MAFDIQGAKKAGYSESEIADYLGQENKFDLQGARKAGYSDSEIIAELSAKPTFRGTAPGGRDPFAVSPKETEVMKARFLAQETGKPYMTAMHTAAPVQPRPQTYLQRLADPENLKAYAKAIEPIARPTISGLASVGGGALGLASPIPGGTVIGGTLAYGGGQQVGDILFGEREPAAPGEGQTMQTLRDIYEGGKGELLGLGAGATLAQVPKVAKFIASPKKTTYEGLAELIGTKPEKMMEQSLKQSTVLSQAERDKNIQTALMGGYLPNQKGVARLKDDIMSINQRIGDAISEGRKAGKMASIDDIVKPIEELKAQAVDSGADWGKNLDTLDNIIESIKTNPKVVNGKIPVDVAQRWKIDVYKQLNENVWGEFTTYAKEGRKALARGAKDVVKELVPEVGDLNAKDSELYGLQDVLERAANRIGNRETIGIGPAIKIGAGAATGKPGMVIGTIAAILEHPSVQPRLAIALFKARKGAITRAQANSIIKERIKNLVRMKTKED